MSPPRVGMVGRFFPGNWRPPAEEIRFATGAGFDALQLRSPIELRTDAREVGRLLAEAGFEPVVELLVRVEEADPLAELRAHLALVEALGCRRVHWHLLGWADVREVERRLVPSLAEAVAVAAREGFAFGLEHNCHDGQLFGTPEACAAALDAVPGLGFVWDVNHARADAVVGFERLLPRLTLVHLSDTPLPETNHHLPFGLGGVDLAARLDAVAASGYDGPLVLEIGGQPRSGGYGRDTDEALRDSLARVREAWPTGA